MFNIHTTLLIIYFIAVVFITFIQDLHTLILVFITLLLLSIKDSLRLLKRVFLSILFFNSVVSISYLTIQILKGVIDLEYLLVVNLRVVDMTYLTFLSFSRIKLFKALSFSKELVAVLVLSYSQILHYKRILEEFLTVLNLRVVKRGTLKDYLSFYGRLFELLFDKSVKNGREISQAMKSRGFFID